MTFWNPESLRSAAGGSWIVRPPQIELPKDRPADLPLPPLHAPITGLSTDSRSIKRGQVFLALKGERFDGHAYLKNAVAAGSPILIVDDASSVPESGFEPAVGVMKVADTAKALVRIAAAYRKTLERTRVIAVCGSNGKTTTTNLIRQVLTACGMRGTASQKSFNNSIGVPLTILGAKPTDQFLVCEVGTNAPGEIAQLAEVVNPDIAVITSIGREHLEKLGDVAGVAREEASVLKHLRPAPKGCAIVNADVAELAEYLNGLSSLITFGRNPQATLRITSIRHTTTTGGHGLGLEFVINGRLPVKLPMVGEHNAFNALAAFAVARRMGMDDARAISALAGVTTPEMRLQPVQAGGVRIINDAYNANPDSMIAGIRTLVQVSAQAGRGTGRTIALLADMLELGASTVEGHAEVGRELLSINQNRTDAFIDMVVLCGPNMRHACETLVEGGWPAASLVYIPTLDDAGVADAATHLRPGDLVLLKGSRRMRLERIVEALKAGCGEGGSTGGVEPKGVIALTG